jgi:hypothetical protein
MKLIKNTDRSINFILDDDKRVTLDELNKTLKSYGVIQREITEKEVNDLFTEAPDIRNKATIFRYDYREVDSFVHGYEECLADNRDKKYTEEDLRKAYEAGRFDHAANIHGFYDFMAGLPSNKKILERDVEIVSGRLMLKRNEEEEED